MPSKRNTRVIMTRKLLKPNGCTRSSLGNGGVLAKKPRGLNLPGGTGGSGPALDKGCNVDGVVGEMSRMEQLEEFEQLEQMKSPSMLLTPTETDFETRSNNSNSSLSPHSDMVAFPGPADLVANCFNIHTDPSYDTLLSAFF